MGPYWTLQNDIILGFIGVYGKKGKEVICWIEIPTIL